MQQLESGAYLGSNIHTRKTEKIILTLNGYANSDSKGWHTHENAFFAFIIKGGNREKREKKVIESTAGSLLYYSAHEPHCNDLYIAGSRIFHIELQPSWFNTYDLHKFDCSNFSPICNPGVKLLFCQIIKEFNTYDAVSNLIIEGLLLQAFAQSNRKDEAIAGFPNWLIHVKELIHNSTGAALSLTQIATQAGVHPATLTKAFPKFFHCTVGEYIRKVRIEYSLALLAKRSLSLDDVAFECGFYDASHYIRVFKELTGCTPSQYRNSL